MINAPQIRTCCPFLLFIHLTKLNGFFSLTVLTAVAIMPSSTFSNVLSQDRNPGSISWHVKFSSLQTLLFCNFCTTCSLCIRPFLVPLSHDIIKALITLCSMLDNCLNLIVSTIADVKLRLSI